MVHHVSCLCTKFEWNRIICGWVIDDLAHVSHLVLTGSTISGWFPGVTAWSNYMKFLEGIGPSSPFKEFVLDFIYLATFRNTGKSKWSWGQISHFFASSPVKIREGSRNVWVKNQASPTTYSGIRLMGGRSAADNNRVRELRDMPTFGEMHVHAWYVTVGWGW